MAHHGRYQVRNRDKYKGKVDKVEYRSGWEYQFMNWCDSNPDIKQWSSEEVIIPYFSSADGKNRRYFMDFWVRFKTGEQYIFEVKPHKETELPRPPKRKTKKSEMRLLKEIYTYKVNRDKWNAAAKYAKERGWKFKVLTEVSLKPMIGLIV